MKFFLFLVLAGFIGCSQNEHANKKETLLDNKWILISLNGDQVNINNFSNGSPWLDLDSVKVFGFTGCNQLSGLYKVNNSEIMFSHLITTKMFCKNVKEKDYLDALNSIDNYEIEDSKLLLFSNDNLKLTFTPLKKNDMEIVLLIKRLKPLWVNIQFGQIF